MDSSFLRPCETFLKRSWRGAATVFAALIALSGVPIEDAQARMAPRSAQGAPANQTPQIRAQPQAQAPVQPQPQPPHAEAGHAAQPAAGQAVESTQPPA